MLISCTSSVALPFLPLLCFIGSCRAGCLPQWTITTDKLSLQVVIVMADHSEVFPIESKLTFTGIIASDEFWRNKLSTKSLHRKHFFPIVGKLDVTVNVCHNDHGSQSPTVSIGGILNGNAA